MIFEVKSGEFRTKVEANAPEEAIIKFLKSIPGDKIEDLGMLAVVTAENMDPVPAWTAPILYLLGRITWEKYVEMVRWIYGEEAEEKAKIGLEIAKKRVKS